MEELELKVNKEVNKAEVEMLAQESKKVTDEKIEKIVNIEEYLKVKKPINRKTQECKRVAQYSIYDEFIKIWNSSSEATEYYSGAKNTTNIQACCRGAKKSAFGFKWKYVD